LFGTLKVQSFILTEVSDCGLLIVVTIYIQQSIVLVHLLFRSRCSAVEGVLVYVHVHVVCVCVYMCVMCTKMHICIYLYVYIYRYTHACTYMCICVFIHVCE